MFAHYFKKTKEDMVFHILIVSDESIGCHRHNLPVGKMHIFQTKNALKKFVNKQGLKPWNF